VTYNIPVMQRHLKICIAHANILSDRMNKNKKKGVVTPDAIAKMVYYHEM